MKTCPTKLALLRDNGGYSALVSHSYPILRGYTLENESPNFKGKSL